MVPWAGLLAPGSFYSPRLPDFCRLDCFITQSPTKVGPELVEGRKESVAMVAVFVPGYSGGSATDLHRLPLAQGGPRIWQPIRAVKKSLGPPWAKGTVQSAEGRSVSKYPCIEVSR